ncbi:hypothetical protein TNCV_1278551 [Trichonephila clavipes]|nr:hypothetical protein TNCV_1278551 [Trichonephila clavipes]
MNWNRQTSCSAPKLPEPQSHDFFFWGYLKSLSYETSMPTVQDLTAWIVIASANITSTLRICLNESDNPSCVSVSCSMTYAVAISNNSCTNYLS